MRLFMGLTLMTFGYFKLLDWSAFADAYAGYDILAKHSRAYAYLYPLIELGLGMMYLINQYPSIINTITIIVMSVSAVGVIQALRRDSHFQCACLGTVIKLPMSTITAIEDIGMGLMALLALPFR